MDKWSKARQIDWYTHGQLLLTMSLYDIYWGIYGYIVGLDEEKYKGVYTDDGRDIKTKQVLNIRQKSDSEQVFK